MKSLYFREEHKMFREALRDFVQNELLPHAAEWEAAEEFPLWVFTRLGELGYLGLRFPEEYGGGNCDIFFSVILSEELARCGAAGVGLGVTTHTELAMPAILKYGTEDQKRRFVVPGTQGTKIGCIAITEPEAGSDVAAIKTKAKLVNGKWIINGQKIFITNGPFADFAVVLARTEEGAGYRGMSLFLVEKTLGFSVSKKLEKVGTHSSPTGELAFEDCQVPEENLLGERGKGFYHIMWELQNERIFAAAAAIARAQVVYEMALDYAAQRVQFGGPIANLQALRHKVADMATQLEAARQLTYHVAWLFDNGEYPVKEISMAKLYATEVAFQVADEAMQIHGGYGYMMDLPVQQYWRDIRVSRFMAGTSEIQKEIIASILLPRAKK